MLHVSPLPHHVRASGRGPDAALADTGLTSRRLVSLSERSVCVSGSLSSSSAPQSRLWHARRTLTAVDLIDDQLFVLHLRPGLILPCANQLFYLPYYSAAAGAAA